MTLSCFERYNVKSLSDLLGGISQNDYTWVMSYDTFQIVWTYELSSVVRVPQDPVIAASATLSVKLQRLSFPEVFYVAITNENTSSSISTAEAKQHIVRMIEELAYLPDNNDINILRFHGNSTFPYFVHLEDFSNEQLRSISCSRGPFEWVNCVFSRQQAIAAFVSSPGKRNVRFLTGGITDGGEEMITYLKQNPIQESLGKLAISASVLRGNSFPFLRVARLSSQQLQQSDQQQDEIPFLWDEMEWVQLRWPPSLYDLLSKVNTYCLTVDASERLLANLLAATFDSNMRARAIRCCISPSSDYIDDALFMPLMRALLSPDRQLLELYLDAHEAELAFWSPEKIGVVIDRLAEQQDKGSRLQVLSLTALCPINFGVDEWNRFLLSIERYPSLRRVELQACWCTHPELSKWVTPLHEMMQRCRSRSHPLKLVFLGNGDDDNEVRFWQLQAFAGRYAGIRSIAASSARALTLVHALSLCTAAALNDSQTTTKGKEWNPDGVYFVLLSNQDLWIPSS